MGKKRTPKKKQLTPRDKKAACPPPPPTAPPQDETAASTALPQDEAAPPRDEKTASPPPPPTPPPQDEAASQQSQKSRSPSFSFSQDVSPALSQVFTSSANPAVKPKSMFYCAQTERSTSLRKNARWTLAVQYLKGKSTPCTDLNRYAR